MTSQQTYLETLKRFKEEHGAEYGIEKIGLFGSVARNEHTDESDVDVFVDAPTMSSFEMAGMRLDLEETFNKAVDLVSYNQYTSQRIGNHIKKDAIYV